LVKLKVFSNRLPLVWLSFLYVIHYKQAVVYVLIPQLIFSAYFSLPSLIYPESLLIQIYIYSHRFLSTNRSVSILFFIGKVITGFFAYRLHMPLITFAPLVYKTTTIFCSYKFFMGPISKIGHKATPYDIKSTPVTFSAINFLPHELPNWTPNDFRQYFFMVLNDYYLVLVIRCCKNVDAWVEEMV